MTTSDWKKCAQELPPYDVEVETKIDDINGCRNEQTLKLHNRMWWLPDMSMYVYYAPTHWRPVARAQDSPNGKLSDKAARP